MTIYVACVWMCTDVCADDDESRSSSCVCVRARANVFGERSPTRVGDTNSAPAHPQTWCKYRSHLTITMITTVGRRVDANTYFSALAPVSLMRSLH